MGEDTQEMPPSQSTALPWHKKKESRGTNNDKTNAETLKHKEELQNRNGLGTVRRETTRVLTHCILNRISHTIYWKSPISILGTSGYEI